MYMQDIESTECKYCGVAIFYTKADFCEGRCLDVYQFPIQRRLGNVLVFCRFFLLIRFVLCAIIIDALIRLGRPPILLYTSHLLSSIPCNTVQVVLSHPIMSRVSSIHIEEVHSDEEHDKQLTALPSTSNEQSSTTDSAVKSIDEGVSSADNMPVPSLAGSPTGDSTADGTQSADATTPASASTADAASNFDASTSASTSEAVSSSSTTTAATAAAAAPATTSEEEQTAGAPDVAADDNPAKAADGGDVEQSGDDEQFLDFEEQFVKNKAKSLEAKERGNKLFGKGQFEDALEAYAEALLLAEEDDMENRPLFHNNKAAAHFMLKQWEEVVYETTQAIHLKEGFARAFHRRGRAFEAMNRLNEALDDFKAAHALEPADRDYKKKADELTIKVQKQFEEQKDEMLKKLKDLGNGILGKFGMSMDQFKAVQDPKTGSYSISFGNNNADPKK